MWFIFKRSTDLITLHIFLKLDNSEYNTGSSCVISEKCDFNLEGYGHSLSIFLNICTSVIFPLNFVTVCEMFFKLLHYEV